MLPCYFKGRGCKHEDSCNMPASKAIHFCGLYGYFDFLQKEYGDKSVSKKSEKEPVENRGGFGFSSDENCAIEKTSTYSLAELIASLIREYGRYEYMSEFDQELFLEMIVELRNRKDIPFYGMSEFTEERAIYLIKKVCVGNKINGYVSGVFLHYQTAEMDVLVNKDNIWETDDGHFCNFIVIQEMRQGIYDDVFSEQWFGLTNSLTVRKYPANVRPKTMESVKI